MVWQLMINTIKNVIMKVHVWRPCFLWKSWADIENFDFSYTNDKLYTDRLMTSCTEWQVCALSMNLLLNLNKRQQIVWLIQSDMQLATYMPLIFNIWIIYLNIMNKMKSHPVYMKLRERLSFNLITRTQCWGKCITVITLLFPAHRLVLSEQDEWKWRRCTLHWS